LFFTALEKVKEYARKAGHLPTIVSENVEGIRYRRFDADQVRCLGFSYIQCGTIELAIYYPTIL
jgi:hypothetical protein